MSEREPWHADEAFWETLQTFLFPPEKVEEAETEVDEVRDLLGLDAGASVLDVPCGVGRHAVELAERDLRVTGVDATAAYLDAARERAREAGVDVRFVEADMRTFSEPDGFDAVLNLYTSFGYFEDREDDERTARNFYESLKPDGTLLMSLAGKELLARDFRERTWEERDGDFLLEEHAVRDDWSWLENRWIVATDEGTQEFDVSHRLYSAHELSSLLERVGFDDVTVYGDFDERDYDQDANRLVVVAEK